MVIALISGTNVDTLKMQYNAENAGADSKCKSSFFELKMIWKSKTGPFYYCIWKISQHFVLFFSIKNSNRFETALVQKNERHINLFFFCVNRHRK